MALIPCPECGRQISTLAASCPGCGGPVGAAPPTQQTQQSPVAEPKSDTATAPPDPQLVKQLEGLKGKYDGHILRLEDDAIPNFLAIIRLCSKEVTRIDLVGNEWQDRHIQQLQEFPNLRELTVSGGEHLTDESLAHIASLQSLTKLDLSLVELSSKGDARGNYDRLTERGYKRLTRLGNLRFIKLPQPDSVMPEPRSKVIAMLEEALPDAFIQ
jgi:hypothetical protein